MLRFPLAIAVVFVHSFGDDLTAGIPCDMPLSGDMVYEYVRTMFSKVIAHGAVPTFFFISGFLFFLKMVEFKKQQYWGKLKKRVHSLAVPYVLWNMLFLLMILFMKVGGILLHGKPWSRIMDYLDEKGWMHIFWDSSIWEERSHWYGWITFNSGPYLLPFWYMRDLMIIVLISPVIYYFIRRFGGYFVSLIGFVYVFDVALPFFSATIISGLFFFSLGACFCIKNRDFTDVLWQYRYVLFTFSIVGIPALAYLGSTAGGTAAIWLYKIVVIVETLTFLTLASALCSCKRLYGFNKALVSTSFFIYAFHPFILGYCMNFVNKILNNNMWYIQILAYFISPLLCVAICLALYFLLRRWCTKTLTVLTGERVL